MTTNDKAMELAREFHKKIIRLEDDDGDRLLAEFIRPHLKPEWQPIETAKRGTEVIAYFPPTDNESHPSNRKPAMIQLTHHPCPWPRKPTHWQPLPEPPKGDQQ